MAKTNYTKVEEALAEGMRKMEVNRLLSIADENKKPKRQPVVPASTPSHSQVEAIHLKRLISVVKELKALHQLGKDPYTDLKIDPQEMEKFCKDPSALSEENWKKIKTIKEQIATYKSGMPSQASSPESANEDLIEQQRKKQITKRFNINDKWIPLR